MGEIRSDSPPEIDIRADDAPEEILKLWSLEHIARGSPLSLIPMRTSMRIGRLPNCEVHLETIPSLSRVHATLLYEPSLKRWKLNDSSSNGTFVNSRIVKEPVAINSGDVISFAQSSLTNDEGALLVQGPEDALPDEGEVDTTEFRNAAEAERRAIEEDLQRRKDARKAREFRQASMLKDKKQSEQLKETIAQEREERVKEDREAREALHEISWGIGDDEVGERIEEENMLNVLDYEELRKKGILTDKQEQMVAKLEQKQRKIEAMKAEKERLERKVCEDTGEDKDNSGLMTRIKQCNEKLEQREQDLLIGDEALRVALGMSERLNRAELCRRADKYDNNVFFDSDDDYFDQTKKAERSERQPQPKIETAETLSAKVALLEAQMIRLSADMVQHTQSSSADMDELDAFMAQNAESINKEKLDKNTQKKAEIEAELADTRRLLEIAKQCHDSSATPRPKRIAEEPAREAKRTMSTQDAIQAATEVFAQKNKEREALAGERRATAEREIAKEREEGETLPQSTLDPNVGGIQIPNTRKKKIYGVERPPDS